jgi:hypothetical protein
MIFNAVSVTPQRIRLAVVAEATPEIGTITQVALLALCVAGPLKTLLSDTDVGVWAALLTTSTELSVTLTPKVTGMSGNQISVGAVTFGFSGGANVITVGASTTGDGFNLDLVHNHSIVK